MNNRLIRIPSPLDVRKQRQNIPDEVLAPVIHRKWKTDPTALEKFDRQLARNLVNDNAAGCGTSVLLTGLDPNPITKREFDSMTFVGAIPTQFYKRDIDGNDWLVNQNFLNSLETLYAHIQQAYDQHNQRIAALLNTPSGQIR